MSASSVSQERRELLAALHGPPVYTVGRHGGTFSVSLAEPGWWRPLARRRWRAEQREEERLVRLMALNEPYRFRAMDVAGWSACVAEARGRRLLVRESIIAGRL